MSWQQTLTTVLVSIASALISLAVAWGGVKAHLENGDIHAPSVERELRRHDVVLERIDGKLGELASTLSRLEGYLEAQKEKAE